MSSEPIYHLCAAAAWQAALEIGRYAGTHDDPALGFIHLSTRAQLAETAALHFSGQADLVLLTVDAEKLGKALRWEPSRGGVDFPHLYGPIPLAAVERVDPVPLSSDGAHLFPALE